MLDNKIPDVASGNVLCYDREDNARRNIENALPARPSKDGVRFPEMTRLFRAVHHFAACTVVIVVIASCADPTEPYLSGEREVRSELRTLIDSLSGTVSSESRFITNQRIISLYETSRARREELLYLTSYVDSYPDDQFNAYYLLLVAERYRSDRALPFARYYYERILKNHPDLLLDGEHSVHRICLGHLIKLVEEPEIRAGYYKELIARFGDDIDRGRLAFELAATYEELGEWDLSMQFYREYLSYPDTPIPGRKRTRAEIVRLVTLYEMPKKPWISDDLDELIASIQRAIWSQNARYLNELRTKVGFFARAWEDTDLESAAGELADLGVYLKNRIRIPGTIDRDSNDREAYLATYGWGYRIPTWYLYFRRLDFPADPSIHSQWEWAGIYLGEKTF